MSDEPIIRIHDTSKARGRAELAAAQRELKRDADKRKADERAENRRKDRENAAKSRSRRLHESFNPDNEAVTDKAVIINIRPKKTNIDLNPSTNGTSPAGKEKPFPFALYPAKSGSSCMFAGRFIVGSEKSRFEKIHLTILGTYLNFNALDSQDGIAPPRIITPVGLDESKTGLKSTEFAWRGNFYLVWEVDHGGDVKSVSIAGPEFPQDARNYPELLNDLSRDFGEGDIGGKYAILIGSVSRDGNVTQNLSSDFHWSPDTFHKSRERTFNIDAFLSQVGGDLDLDIRTFTVASSEVQREISISIPEHSTNTDGAHCHQYYDQWAQEYETERTTGIPSGTADGGHFHTIPSFSVNATISVPSQSFQPDTDFVRLSWRNGLYVGSFANGANYPPRTVIGGVQIPYTHKEIWTWIGPAP